MASHRAGGADAEGRIAVAAEVIVRAAAREAELAAAVSEAGGLGIIGAGGAPASWVEEQIHKVKEKTDKPFGVNLMLLNPEADAIAELLVKEEVKVVTTGAGNPEKYQVLLLQSEWKRLLRTRLSQKVPSQADILERQQQWH